MKIITHNAEQFNVKLETSEHSYLLLEISSGIEVLRCRGLIDSGATASILPMALAERLGMNSALPLLGMQTAETANGKVTEPVTKVTIRVVGSDKKSTLFEDVPVSLSKSLTDFIVGMDLMRYFNIQIKNGKVVVFSFDDNSVFAQS